VSGSRKRSSPSRFKVTAFQELEAYLTSEINSLGYPKAASFGFCVALVTYNVLAVLEADIRFFNRSPNRLAEVLCVEKTASAASLAVLLCLGLSGIKHLVLPEIAAGLAERGIASLHFDYRSCGESERERGWIDWRSRVDDAFYGLAWLAQNDVIDANHLLMLHVPSRQRRGNQPWSRSTTSFRSVLRFSPPTRRSRQEGEAARCRRLPQPLRAGSTWPASTQCSILIQKMPHAESVEDQYPWSTARTTTPPSSKASNPFLRTRQDRRAGSQFRMPTATISMQGLALPA